MGKSQSKLSADELAELQKNTYCAYTALLELQFICSPLVSSCRPLATAPSHDAMERRDVM